jgi:hypothetical protein
MSGFMGSTKTTENVPSDIVDLRKGFASFLMNQGFGALNTGAPDISAYQDLFKQQNAENFAQAKEASGNLTGTGYANKLGAAARKADVEQTSFLANLLENAKQANANRLAQVFSPFANTGVAAPTTSYQPGFLDYLTQGGSQVLSAAGGAGGFSKLFS